MATIYKGYSFGATEEVTAAKLHSLVDSASISDIATADISNNAVTNDKIYSVSGAKFTSLASIPSGAGQMPTANALDVVKAIYPVGSLYFSTISTNPATLLGFGTWTAFGAGKTLIGIDSGDADFDTAEETGGSKTKTLIEANLPAHTHEGGAHTHDLEWDKRTSGSSGAVYRGTDPFTPDYDSASVHTYTQCASGARAKSASAGTTSSVGSGTAVNVMNPYVVVYMFKRTA